MSSTEDKFIRLLRRQKQIRVMGIDDSPFVKDVDPQVSVSGIVCANTRFEGMIWTEVTRDGDDATETLITQIRQSKFYEQLHLILLDGVAMAGFNVVDLKQLSEALQLPCLTLMRKAPDLVKMKRAMQKVPHTAQKLARLKQAGPIYRYDAFYYQAYGLDPGVSARVLQQLTDTGNVPEALRLAHLIGAAVKLGESTRRA